MICLTLSGEIMQFLSSQYIIGPMFSFLIYSPLPSYFSSHTLATWALHTSHISVICHEGWTEFMILCSIYPPMHCKPWHICLRSAVDIATCGFSGKWFVHRGRHFICTAGLSEGLSTFLYYILSPVVIVIRSLPFWTLSLIDYFCYWQCYWLIIWMISIQWVA